MRNLYTLGLSGGIGSVDDAREILTARFHRMKGQMRAGEADGVGIQVQDKTGARRILRVRRPLDQNLRPCIFGYKSPALRRPGRIHR